MIKKTLIGKILLLALLFTLTACSKDDANEPKDNTPEEEEPVFERNFNITADLSDPSANESAKALYSWMRNQFGKKVLSGQTFTDEYWDYIKGLTGKTPLIMELDFQTYSPMYPYLWDSQCNCQTFGPDPESKITEKAIDWYNKNEKKPIIKFQWHWHSPMGGQPGKNTFYTDQTTFDVRQAVIEGTPEYQATIRDIDAIAVQLNRLQDQGIAVLWRPLHEFDGGWFWWSAHGAEPAKKLWNIMYDRLTKYHNLHNLIWIWNGDKKDWYVGNDKCDIVTADIYGTAFVYKTSEDEFNTLYRISDGTKMIGISENGTIPNVAQALQDGVSWGFFITWQDHLFKSNSDEQILRVFNNPNVITLENYN